MHNFESPNSIALNTNAPCWRRLDSAEGSEEGSAGSTMNIPAIMFPSRVIIVGVVPVQTLPNIALSSLCSMMGVRIRVRDRVRIRSRVRIIMHRSITST
jgi:hypothetical protein